MLIDLLAKYPKSHRDPSARAAVKTPEDMEVARRFGKEFFDGERRHGYGGYTYSQTRWVGVVNDFLSFYGKVESLLDVGCAKGYFLQEFKLQSPETRIEGVDVSEYAIEASPEDMRPVLRVANAIELPYPDKAFDLVVSINTVHNLEMPECIKALQELNRVALRSYVTVDAYRNSNERRRMLDWNLTAKTILSTERWEDVFAKVGYRGDWGFFIP